MWTCWRHNIHLLYLPPHSSHILQPLDLAPFSVVKSKYRNQIMDLSVPEDAAPVKKERFISAYHKAGEAGMLERVIRAGRGPSGLCPYNPELVIQSSQVSSRPTTSPNTQTSSEDSDQALNTPQNQQTLYVATQDSTNRNSLPTY